MCVSVHVCLHVCAHVLSSAPCHLGFGGRVSGTACESSMADWLVTPMDNVTAIVLTAAGQSHEPPALQLGPVAPEAPVCDSMSGLALW